jgi:hypothetical protein
MSFCCSASFSSCFKCIALVMFVLTFQFYVCFSENVPFISRPWLVLLLCTVCLVLFRLMLLVPKVCSASVYCVSGFITKQYWTFLIEAKRQNNLTFK